MSDFMLLGILRMPIEADGGIVAFTQFRSAAMSAAERIEALTAERDRAEDELYELQQTCITLRGENEALAAVQPDAASAGNLTAGGGAGQMADTPLITGLVASNLTARGNAATWALYDANLTRMGALQPAHVNETPKSEHDAGNMLTPATKGDWQPIETAPKRRVIDLWSVEGERYPDAIWGVCGDVEGWTDANDHGNLGGGMFTHWRDRPAPPATKGDDA